jgi:L-malate glycosyltransferase
LLFAGKRSERVAFWGHGRNMQAASQTAPLDSFKRWTTSRVDWWFAYTALSADFVRAAGFPCQSITVLENSVDTAVLVEQVAQARLGASLAALRAGFGLANAPTGLFIGSLYGEKRLPFLIAAANAIRLRIPTFQLAIAGAGPEEAMVQTAAVGSPAIRFLGRVEGERKAKLLACADLMLNPGLIGLGILDAFAAALPLVTTDCGVHAPEVCYLKHGVNGLMTANNLNDFVDTCQMLLFDPALRQFIGRNAGLSVHQYSLRNMAERFSLGILSCLEQPVR